MATALDILSDRVSPLQQQINQYGESSIGTSQSSSPPVLETLLTLIRTTTDFVELAVRKIDLDVPKNTYLGLVAKSKAVMTK